MNKEEQKIKITNQIERIVTQLPEILKHVKPDGIKTLAYNAFTGEHFKIEIKMKKIEGDELAEFEKWIGTEEPGSTIVTNKIDGQQRLQ